MTDATIAEYPPHDGPWPNCPACGKQAGVIRDDFAPPTGHCPDHGLFRMADGVFARREEVTTASGEAVTLHSWPGG